MSVETVQEPRDCPMCGEPSPLTLRICHSCGERLVTRPGDLPEHDQFRRRLYGLVMIWVVAGTACIGIGFASSLRGGRYGDSGRLTSLLPMIWGAGYLVAGWGTARRSVVFVWIAIGLSIPVIVISLVSIVSLPLGLILFFGMLHAYQLAAWLRLARRAGITL